MTRPRFLSALALLLALAIAPALAEDFETLELNPLAEKDLSSFKVEGDGVWKIDNETDLIYALIVCPKAPDDTSLLFIGKTFKAGFQLRLEVMGGSRNKGLDLLIVPPEGDRIPVPFSRRWLSKSDWHDVVLTVEDGKATVEVDDEKGEAVEVPKGVPLTFAMKLDKRSEAMFRKLKIRFLVVHEDQKAAEEGFVRIFDGKTLEGWRQLPDGLTAWEVKGDHVFGQVPEGRPEVDLLFSDAQFRNYVLKCRVSADTRNLIIVGRPGIKDQYPPTYCSVSNYFPGDRDWNDVSWVVNGKEITLVVNGSRVWSKEAPNDNPFFPMFALTQGGQARIRDIQVKGDLASAGPAWARYAKESGVDGGGQFGGRGNDQPDPGGATSFEKKVLFDGTSIDDWRFGPAGVWQVVADEKKLIGLTLDQPTAAEILYGKLVFFEYSIHCQVQKGTVGASFIAKRVPKEVAEKPDAVVKLDDAWFPEPWNEFEAWCRDGLLKIKVNGKEVYTGKVPTEQGFMGFRIEKDSAIGLKDIVFSRPQ